MNKKLQRITLTIASLLFLQNSWAQTETSSPKVSKKTIEISLVGGVHIGGTMPFNLPNTIRSVDAYAPKTPLFLGVKFGKNIHPNWQINTGLIIEGKGFKTEASVKGYETEFNASQDEKQGVHGFYYGSITTQMNNVYATIPLEIQYNCNKWNVYGGLSLSGTLAKNFEGKAIEGYLRAEDPTGERIGLSNVAYNFDHAVRSINVGGQLGIKYQASATIGVLAQGNIGITNTLKPNFESVTFPMHHAYLSLGISYKIK